MHKGFNLFSAVIFILVPHMYIIVVAIKTVYLFLACSYNLTTDFLSLSCSAQTWLCFLNYFKTFFIVLIQSHLISLATIPDSAYNIYKYVLPSLLKLQHLQVTWFEQNNSFWKTVKYFYEYIFIKLFSFCPITILTLLLYHLCLDMWSGSPREPKD